MEALIANFRGGKHTKYDNHMIGIVDGIASRDKAKALVQKPIVWTSPAGKEIKGYIANVHGNKGALRLIFEKGMPGQAIGTKIKIG